MDVKGRVVVVTGGASGIGRALARRFAADGAKGVVIADRDGDKARETADAIGGLAIETDVSKAEDNNALIDKTEATFGPVDLFCANAGVTGALGLEDGFEDTFAINVMAHVHAARRLIPGWVERQSGYFLSTASAAGLLTQIGGAQYSITKHGAVAFAEWLAITYGDQGIKVSCLCPQGVNTPMLHQGDDASDQTERAASAVVAAAGNVLEPEDVADVVVAALKEERFLILPHPEVLDYWRRKSADYDRWLAGMRRLQAQIVAATSA